MNLGASLERGKGSVVRRPTQGDVAERAGVSQALVSIAFRGAAGVSAETKARIFKAARELNYALNANAAKLASKSTATVGVFLLNLRNELFSDIFDGIREGMAGKGRHLVLSIGSARESEPAAIADLVGARVEVIIAAGLLTGDADALQLGNGVHIVSASRRIDGLDSVYSDDYLGGQIATNHLIQMGHRLIVHLGSPPGGAYTERSQGYASAMKNVGLPPRVIRVEYGRAAAAEACAAVLESALPPTAIFANNDEAAFGVLDAVAARGSRCPQDLSLVGYDNVASSSLPGVRLTTVDILGSEIGRRAAALALRRLGDPSAEPAYEVLEPLLIQRGTTREL